MGREVRRVPADWQHPRDYRGKYEPLHGGSYSKDAEEWLAEFRQWLEGKHDAQMGEYATGCRYYWEYAGPPPDKEDYMPDWPEAERTHLMMYEDTTEGTPISPAFATPEELARWLAENGASAFGGMTATYEQWLRTCRQGWTPSAVMDAGRLRSGVEL